MKIEYDPAKKAANLARHGLDFDDAPAVLSGFTFEVSKIGPDGGEARTVSIGHLAGRMVMVVWTWRGPSRRIISMRTCNEKERFRYAPRF